MNWRSTKFIQTSFVLITSALLVCTGHVSDNTYMLLTGAALGNYAYHDVKQKVVS